MRIRCEMGRTYCKAGLAFAHVGESLSIVVAGDSHVFHLSVVCLRGWIVDSTLLSGRARPHSAGRLPQWAKRERA